MTSNKIGKITICFAAAFVVLLGVYLYQVEKITTKGFLINGYEKEIAEIKEVLSQSETTIENRLARLEENSFSEKKFVEINQIEYIPLSSEKLAAKIGLE